MMAVNEDTEENSPPLQQQRLFLINKGNIPLDEETWSAMLERIKINHPQGEKVIEIMREKEKKHMYPKSAPELEKPVKKGGEIEADDKCAGENQTRNGSTATTIEDGDIVFSSVPFVAEPKSHANMSALRKMTAIQKYLNQLQYNHTGMQFFNIKKSRPISRLYDTAKEMIKLSLPIKCLEAVVLSLYLTASIKNVSRFTIRFKTKFSKITHKHIVLGVYYNAQYGALGLSRRKTLMDKPIAFSSLTELILEYKKCYEECFHVLQRVKMSPCLSSDIHSCDQVSWNHYTLNIAKLTDQEIKHSLEKYSREMRKKTDSIL